MKIREFTEEEMTVLRSNMYVVQVTAQFVYFSSSFKERFYNEYQAGKKPKRIIESMQLTPKTFLSR